MNPSKYYPEAGDLRVPPSHNSIYPKTVEHVLLCEVMATNYT